MKEDIRSAAVADVGFNGSSETRDGGRARNTQQQALVVLKNFGLRECRKRENKIEGGLSGQLKAVSTRVPESASQA